MALPSRSEIRFWDRIAKRYARGAVSDRKSYERKLSETATLLTPDMRVLEVGCGTGTTALHHAPQVAHIRAIDVSPAMLDIARAKARAAGIENVTFEEAAVEQIVANAGSFDLVMAHSILHLVSDPAAVISHMARLLKPGGHFVTSSTCMADGMGLFRLITVPGHALGLLPRITYFSAADLRDMIQDAGLTIDTDWQPGPRKAVFIIARKG